MASVYKEAGVDIEKGYEAVQRIKKHVDQTKRPEVLGKVGGFGGLFDLSSLPYKEPVLVSGTDGVGTKLKLAFELEQHHTIGIDLVAMCVNDIVAQGAEPLFFLDYIASGKLEPHVIEQIVSGIATGCVEAGAALIGGETAEMPGMYQVGEYDLAGFAVGVAEKSRLITGDEVVEGDVVIGLSASGIHSNGYSLVRKVITDLNLSEVYPGLSQPLGDLLMEPTKIYAKAIKDLMKSCQLKAIAHITGGGFYENLPRMLPENLGVEIKRGSWHVPDIFTFIQEKGNISEAEMFHVFNMGIGMAIVVAEDEVDQVLGILQGLDEDAQVIGTVTREKGVSFR
ncbi:phosphoribosylformylglycinamidine cyclo-ligase [Virgibacillus soli]|uniref:phosphoribosylformylglycinamidine cyclo-ligase n=1 Tax=Paracerasibacillus soli TaxID=480284 RepID=UPI0035EC12A3